MKKLFLGLAIAFIASISVFSQSSEKLGSIIKSREASFAQISYLPALYNNLITENDSEEKAFEALQNEGYFSTDITADSNVTLQQACGVLMKSLKINGGLFYTIFKNNRYAYKELKARAVLPQTADPSSKISGRDFIDLFNACLELTGDN